MSEDPYAERKRMTFEQAEGLAPLPAQLKLREVSQEMRALLWEVFHQAIESSANHPSMGGPSYLHPVWKRILFDEHVRRRFKMADEFKPYLQKNIERLKRIFEHETYGDLLGLIQFVLQHPSCPPLFLRDVSIALRHARAAYVVVERTIVPAATKEEGDAVIRAVKLTGSTELNGAKNHLLAAASNLTAGDAAGSVRESISSVESIVRTLEPDGDFGAALTKLEKAGYIHGAMKGAFGKLYGYASDEKGVRHSLLMEGSANVDETDAQFMLAACAAFVSYLVGKAREAGLLKK